MGIYHLYKQDFEKEHGWKIEDVAGDDNGRLLMKVTVGEKQFGDNTSPMQIEIYEDILQELLDNKQEFSIIQGRREQQVHILYRGRLLEYNPDKKKQYALLRTELKKRRYHIKARIKAYRDLFLKEALDIPIPDGTVDFVGSVNARLQENFPPSVIRCMLHEILTESMQTGLNFSENKTELAEYLQNLSKEDLYDLMPCIVEQRLQAWENGDNIDSLAEAFSLKRREVTEAVREEAVLRILNRQCLLS